MGWNVLGAAAAFVCGGAVAYGNYALTKRMLLKKQGAKSLSGVSALRQVINVAYLVLVSLLAKKLPLSMAWLLIGAVLGLTIPMFLFTARLAKLDLSSGDGAQVRSDEKGGEN